MLHSPTCCLCYALAPDRMQFSSTFLGTTPFAPHPLNPHNLAHGRIHHPPRPQKARHPNRVHPAPPGAAGQGRGGKRFKIVSEYQPAADQPTAIPKSANPTRTPPRTQQRSAGPPLDHAHHCAIQREGAEKQDVQRAKGLAGIARRDVERQRGQHHCGQRPHSTGLHAIRHGL